MMMMRNRGGKLKWVVALMIAFMAIRMVIFALAGGGFAGSGWMWVIPVVMVLMMALMFFGPGRMMHGPQQLGSEGSASEILARRFAKGELTKDQYEEMEQALREHAASPEPDHGKRRRPIQAGADGGRDRNVKVDESAAEGADGGTLKEQ